MRIRPYLLIVAAGIALFIAPSSAGAQSIGNELDEIENATKCVAGDDECIADARADDRPIVITDSDGNILAPDRQPVDSPAKNADAVAAANTKAALTRGSPTQSRPASFAARPGEGAWANYDFIPGERVLFADDFRADPVGTFPQRLEFIFGDLKLVDGAGIRYLRAGSNSRFAVNLPEALPQRFTIEFDIALAWNGMIVYGGPDQTTTNRDLVYPVPRHSFILVSGTGAGLRHAGGAGGSVINPRAVTSLEEDIDGHLYRVRVLGDGTHFKVYIDEHRIADIPDADFLRTNQLIFELAGGLREDAMMIGNIAINAGWRNLYEAIQSDGRAVTRGILFDADSDRIRPESSPTLKMIGEMLRDHADLKLGVEIHTDNQMLSEQRAQAVVAYLTNTYAIAPARLQARGIRATEDRVELLRME